MSMSAAFLFLIKALLQSVMVEKVFKGRVDT